MDTNYKTMKAFIKEQSLIWKDTEDDYEIIEEVVIFALMDFAIVEGMKEDIFINKDCDELFEIFHEYKDKNELPEKTNALYEYININFNSNTV
jgi:hypothetical protein